MHSRRSPSVKLRRRRYRKGSPDILKLVPTETADECPGCDADDGFATTESEFAMPSVEAAECSKRLDKHSLKISCKAYG